ncbi:hypothetical protein MPSI1_004048 [Malassezia psittaci]|uniref:Ubiquinol-cytochrome C reductase hinge domain-containing protein n=1 Tax=Malassezia psittaci TaxID=1821823 RepID=A0AAF0F8U2_9BASI|nr:hypothetical protein MPSI1_004048 [Malassezia psittaci]
MSLLSALSSWGMSTSVEAQDTGASSWYSAFLPIAHAEEDQQDDDAEDAEGGASDAGDAEGSEDSEDGGDDEEEDDDDDEDEEEPEDVMPKIYEGVFYQHALTPECEKSAPCAGALHHFEECQERVMGGKQLFENEDCTEELYV